LSADRTAISTISGTIVIAGDRSFLQIVLLATRKKMSAVAQPTRPSDGNISDFSMLLASAPVGFARCLPHGLIVPLNGAMERILGKSAAGGSSILPLLVPPDNRVSCEKMLRELAAGLRDNFHVESFAGDRTFEWIVWSSRSQKGTRSDLLALAHEVTVTPATDTEKNSRLETAGRLVSSVAHDFNNWITGMLLYSDLLLGAIEVGHPARKYAEEIRAAGVHATGFVRQLLSFTRPAPRQPQALSLNDIVESMKSMLLHLVGENIHVQVQLEPKLGLVKIDPTEARQILLNLVLNSRDAMPEGGRIIVGTNGCRVESLSGSTSSCLPCVLLTVEDNGTGIAAAIRSQIFQPFFTTKAGKGTGLGLSTVRDIVTRNGGLIHIDSEPGRGTRVSVLLPAICDGPAVTSNDFYPQQAKVPSSTNEES
jgi:signal transduction histidine kinase